MAGLMKSSIAVFMVTMMVASTTMAQTRHVVGGPLGWTIPPNGAYTTWASQQTFTVGDTLYFNFTTGAHNVAEVAQAAYGPCTTTNPISLNAAGPATLTLAAAGNHYYVCTVGTHCQIGQKLTINVVGAATAPTTPPPTATPPTPTVSPPTATPSPAPVSPPNTTPTPNPTATPATTPAPSPVEASPPSPTTTTGPTPSGSTTPPPASETTPTPPSPSTATRSFAAVVPATFLAFALAFFF